MERALVALHDEAGPLEEALHLTRKKIAMGKLDDALGLASRTVVHANGHDLRGKVVGIMHPLSHTLAASRMLDAARKGIAPWRGGQPCEIGIQDVEREFPAWAKMR